MEINKKESILTYITLKLKEGNINCRFIGESDYYYGQTNLEYEIIETEEQFIIAISDACPYSLTMKGIKMLVKHVNLIGYKNYYQNRIDSTIAGLVVELQQGNLDEFG